MTPTTARNLLISLLLFLGVGALGGGSLLVISPSGKLLGGLPLSMLKNSPFNSFLIPGIILFTVFGLVPCLLIIALLKQPKSAPAEKLNFCRDMNWAWTYTIYIAFALIIWIQIEMVFLQAIIGCILFTCFLQLPLFLLPQVRNLYKIKPIEK